MSPPAYQYHGRSGNSQDAVQESPAGKWVWINVMSWLNWFSIVPLAVDKKNDSGALA